jgi:hypothetical protein
MRKKGGFETQTTMRILCRKTIFSFRHNTDKFCSFPVLMAKRLTNSVITGSDNRLGLYFYYSPHFGHNIIRKTSSLTGIRVKTDNAFKGFRESGNRMKQASPIAASLYKLIPDEIKQYSIYRFLTGEALKMLKAGFDIATIIENLRRIHIEPLLNEPDKEFNRRKRIKPEKDYHQKGLKSFISFPEQTIRNTGKLGRKRWHQFPIKNGQSTELQSASTSLSVQKNNSLSRTNPVLPDLIKNKHLSISTEEKIPELIYIGKLSECKKLKLWVRSVGFPLAGL